MKNKLMIIYVGIIMLPTLVFGQSSGGSGKDGILKSGSGKCNGPDCNFQNFINAIKDVIKFMITLGIAFSVVLFAIAGWKYLTAGGDEGKIKDAHDMLWKGVIGFLIAIGAFLLVELITSTLGLDTSKVNINL